MEERLGLHAEAMGLLDSVVQHVTDEDLERPTAPGLRGGGARRRRTGVGVRAGAVQPRTPGTWRRGSATTSRRPTTSPRTSCGWRRGIKDRAYGEGRPFRERLTPEGSDWEQALRLLGREPGWAPDVS